MRTTHSLITGMSLLGTFVATTSLAQQKYSQYIDAETAVVRAPEGFASNDDAWRSGWFYASLLIIEAKDKATYEKLVATHGLNIDRVTDYLNYFLDKCVSDKSWRRATTLSNDFSRDQLVPTMYLLGCVEKFGSKEQRATGKKLVKSLIKLDRSQGAISPDSGGKIHPNLQYVIDVLARKYDLDYANGNQRSLFKAAFTGALKAHAARVQLPGDEATRDSYSVFNTLSLVTLQAVAWGADDSDVKSWRANYRQHADKGWGPAFKIVSGRDLDDSDIDAYFDACITRNPTGDGPSDIDIVMAQRPKKYLDGSFHPNMKEADGRWLVLDYVILKGLDLAWK